MIGKAVTLGLAGIAAAAPATPPAVMPHYPETSIAKGFNLVVNVTDPSRDFSPSIQNTYLTSIHVGAGLNLVGSSDNIDYGRIFYVNGTASQVFYGQSRIITDGGTPPFPEGLSVVKEEGSDIRSDARLDAGRGDEGFGIARFPNPYAVVAPEGWYACNEELPYYQGRKFIVIKQAKLSIDGDNIPAECAPISLIPQCAILNDLPEGSRSSHEFAADSKCYEDVASINWPDYGP